MLVKINVSGCTLVAETNPLAPRTVAAFAKLLPWRVQLVHVRWSGEAGWVPLGDTKYDFGVENATAHPSPGDFIFYPGGFSESEVLLAYGPCSFSSKLGPLAGNHFMTVVAGREHLGTIGKRLLWEGAQDILFEEHSA